jgi:hypothetical protein
VLLLKGASKHALRTLRSNKAVLGLNRGQKGEPAFYLIKTFFPFVFFAPKKKQIRWEAGRGLSFFTEVAPVGLFIYIESERQLALAFYKAGRGTWVGAAPQPQGRFGLFL